MSKDSKDDIFGGHETDVWATAEPGDSRPSSAVPDSPTLGTVSYIADQWIAQRQAQEAAKQQELRAIQQERMAQVDKELANSVWGRHLGSEPAVDNAQSVASTSAAAPGAAPTPAITDNDSPDHTPSGSDMPEQPKAGETPLDLVQDHPETQQSATPPAADRGQVPTPEAQQEMPLQAHEPELEQVQDKDQDRGQVPTPEAQQEMPLQAHEPELEQVQDKDQDRGKVVPTSEAQQEMSRLRAQEPELQQVQDQDQDRREVRDREPVQQDREAEEEPQRQEPSLDERLRLDQVRGEEATQLLRDHLTRLDAAEQARQEAAERGEQVRGNVEVDAEREMKKRIPALQKLSRKHNREGHLNLYLERLGRIPRDEQQQLGSEEFAQLKRTIGRMPPDMARKLLNERFTKDQKEQNEKLEGSFSQIHPEAFRLLRSGVKSRAPMAPTPTPGVTNPATRTAFVSERVYGDPGDTQALDKLGAVEAKGTISKSSAPGGGGSAMADAYATASGGSLTPAFADDGRARYESHTYLNVPKLQASKEKEFAKGTGSFKGYIRLAESSVRSYLGTASLIDPSKIAQANQSLLHGMQVEHNWIHFNYKSGFEFKPKSLLAGEVKPALEGTVDGFVGPRGDLRIGFSAGQYPALQIQGAAYLGARASAEGKAKLKLLGKDLVELKGKVYASVGVEASGTMAFGRAYDSIEGQSIVTGAEFGGMAFAGVRAGYEAGGEIGGFGGKVKGEIWKGVGLVHKWYATKDKEGNINLGGEYGAALGVGGSFGWGVSINPGKLLKAINKDLPDKVDSLAAAAGHQVATLAHSGARTVAQSAPGRMIASTSQWAAETAPGRIVVATGAGAGKLASSAAHGVAVAGREAGRSYNKSVDKLFRPDLRDGIRAGRGSPRTSIQARRPQPGREVG